MIEYAEVIERSPTNYGAWVPDLDGCVSTGKTFEEAKTISPKRSRCTSNHCVSMVSPSHPPQQR